MPKSILIVDDSASLRGITRLALEQAGYGVTEACDGRDACAKLGRLRFDLVISDVSMPHLDGLGFLKHLKSVPEHQNTPVVMLTTESSVARKEEFRRAGARAWITKPVAPSQLIDMVQRFCT